MAEPKQKIRCEKCKKLLVDTNYYRRRSGDSVNMCKSCYTMHVDVFDESTFLWLIQDLDLPFIPSEWRTVIDKDMAAKPNAPIDNTAIFGKYVARMKLKHWKDYHWADTEKLQAELEDKAALSAAQQAELDQFYEEQLNQGIITEAEYNTRASAKARNERNISKAATAEPFLGNDNPFNENNFIDEAELPDMAAQLTRDDMIALSLKWGRLYQPHEWVELERLYREMDEDFKLEDADSKANLILLCKTVLKQNQAIDTGDIDGYQKLSKVSEGLRKTMKLTAAQNKQDKGDVFDSIGEIIILCEKQGFIPRFCTDVPQDKVDATLRDQQEYISRLVREDLGFGQQIDNALKRIEIQRQLEEAEQNEDEDGLLMSDEEILAARAAEEEDFLKDLMDTGEEAEM